MSTLKNDLHSQATETALQNLKRAARFLTMNYNAVTKTDGSGADRVAYRWELPGVLVVFDPNDGRVLARLVVGHPLMLDPSFDACAALRSE